MTATRPTVVLIHGLLRSQKSLRSLDLRLQEAGYPTWSVSYPSRQLDLQALAEWLHDRIARELPDRPLAAVTHSLGGVLLRLLADRLPWQSAVLIAPPNSGSRVAKKFVDLALFRAIYGPAGVQLATGPGERLEVPPPPQPFGVIAGTQRFSLGNPTSWLTHPLELFGADADHDGTVAVDETHHPDMADFVAIAANHTWILQHPETARQVLEFLAHGRFAHAPSA